MSSAAAFYVQSLGQRQQRREALAVIDRRYATLRLLMVIMALVLFWAAESGYASHGWLWLPFAGFMVLVVYHRRLLEALDAAGRAVEFYEAGLRRVNDEWADKGNTGARFEDAAHPYAADLDLFGAGSLYELLCTARTRPGEERLAAWLLEPAPPDVVRRRQLAVAELRDKVELCEQLNVAVARTGQLDVRALRAWAEAPARLQGWWVRAVAVVLAMVSAALVVAWCIGYPGWWMLSMLVLQGAFVRTIDPGVADVVEQIDATRGDFGVLAGFLERFESETFTSPLLSELQQAAGVPAAAAVRRLEWLAQLLESHRNLFFAPLGYVLMWNLQFAHAIENWRRQFGSRVAAWLEAVAETEALASLAMFAHESQSAVFPELVEGEATFAGSDLRHPLLPHCVPNSVRLDASRPLLVVSGSNMSGKSSLLRTVGINVVLAQAGSTVRADSLRLSPLRLGASIRLSDSLRGGISRFYAEITRLRQIVELAGHEMTLLFLLDEMLAGTNSYDRGIGARALMQTLVQRGAMGLVTTHDLALTEVSGPLSERIANVHFEDQLVDGKMVFDYQLRDGVVRKSNAIELMRAVGLEV